MADDGTRKLGPGELTIGATGTEIDVSCLINNATIAASKDQGDSTTKLCGTVKPGATTYTYALSGNVDIDAALGSGLFAASQSQAGTEMAFVFTPNNEFTAPATTGTTASGTLTLDPLDFGGDTMGDVMTSDFEFAITGTPSYAYETPGALADDADADTGGVFVEAAAS
jgi:hypothetical protein